MINDKQQTVAPTGELQGAAEKINTVIDTLLQKQETRTADVGGSLGTRAFTEQVVQGVES